MKKAYNGILKVNGLKKILYIGQPNIKLTI